MNQRRHVFLLATAVVTCICCCTKPAHAHEKRAKLSVNAAFEPLRGDLAAHAHSKADGLLMRLGKRARLSVNSALDVLRNSGGRSDTLLRLGKRAQLSVNAALNAAMQDQLDHDRAANRLLRLGKRGRVSVNSALYPLAMRLQSEKRLAAASERLMRAGKRSSGKRAPLSVNANLLALADDIQSDKVRDTMGRLGSLGKRSWSDAYLQRLYDDSNEN